MSARIKGVTIPPLEWDGNYTGNPRGAGYTVKQFDPGWGRWFAYKRRDPWISCTFATAERAKAACERHARELKKGGAA